MLLFLKFWALSFDFSLKDLPNSPVLPLLAYTPPFPSMSQYYF